MSVLSKLPGVSYSSLEKAGMPSDLKTRMRSWIDRTIAAGGDTPESAKSIAKLHAVAAVEGVRSTGESLVFGGILGAVHAALPNGLDVKIPGTQHNLPVDAAGAVLGLVSSVFAAQEPYGMGKTLAQGGASCAAVFAFRKTNDLIVEMNIRKSGITPGGGAQLPGKISKAATFNGDFQGDFGAEHKRTKRGGVVGSIFGAESSLDPIAEAAKRL